MSELAPRRTFQNFLQIVAIGVVRSDIHWVDVAALSRPIQHCHDLQVATGEAGCNCFDHDLEVSASGELRGIANRGGETSGVVSTGSRRRGAGQSNQTVASGADRGA